MDPDAIVAELRARPVDPLGVDPRLQEALELAGDDAFRLGQSEIGPENLLFGLLRRGGLPVGYFTKVSRMDLDRFRADVSDRVGPVESRVERPKIPLNPDAQAIIQAAIASATERRRKNVNGIHLLYALTREENGPAGDWLARYGSSAAALNTELQRAL
jgi:ATP-dependent Clp protease ATP-binding subunit ClpA